MFPMSQGWTTPLTSVRIRLRHGAASLILAADVDIQVVADVLGHFSTGITRDTYVSVIGPLKWQVIDAVASGTPAPSLPGTPIPRSRSAAFSSSGDHDSHPSGAGVGSWSTASRRRRGMSQ